MPIIHHNAAIRCLVSVRGHPFDRTAFDSVFQSMTGISATMVDQPAAGLLMNPEGMADFDVLVLYDMPGLNFESGPGSPSYLEPTDALKNGFSALLDEGKGIVALHHALAGWPTWSEYHEWLGGQFLYHPGTVFGEPMPDSGYAHDVTHDVVVIGTHPVTYGLPDRFTVTDELYLCPVDLTDATPLIRSSAEFTRDHFWSADLAVRGQMHEREGWHHPPGSSMLGWAKQVRESRLVYLQPGDSQSAYGNRHYRRLVENAIRWVARA